MGIRHLTDWKIAELFPYVIYFSQCNNEQFVLWSDGLVQQDYGIGDPPLSFGYVGQVNIHVKSAIRAGYV